MASEPIGAAEREPSAAGLADTPLPRGVQVVISEFVGSQECALSCHCGLWNEPLVRMATVIEQLRSQLVAQAPVMEAAVAHDEARGVAVAWSKKHWPNVNRELHHRVFDSLMKLDLAIAAYRRSQEAFVTGGASK